MSDSHEWGNITFWPRPLGRWRGVKRSNKAYFKDIYTKLCACYHKWYNFILSPGSCHRVLGQKLNYVHLSVMLSPPKSFDEIQLNFVYEFHEWGVQQHVFGLAPWGPGEGSKGQISLYCNHKVNLTNKRYKTYWMEFLFCGLGHAPSVKLGGCSRQVFQRGDLRWRAIDCAV